MILFYHLYWTLIKNEVIFFVFPSQKVSVFNFKYLLSSYMLPACVYKSVSTATFWSWSRKLWVPEASLRICFQSEITENRACWGIRKWTHEQMQPCPPLPGLSHQHWTFNGGTVPHRWKLFIIPTERQWGRVSIQGRPGIHSDHPASVFHLLGL